MQKVDRQHPVPSNKEEEPEFFRLAKLASPHTLLGRERLYTLWQCLSNTRLTPGNILEVGTYKGGSALFIAEAMKIFSLDDRLFSVVDTFEGHPDRPADADSRWHPPGHFSDTSYQAVVALLERLPHATIFKGAFEAVESKFSQEPFAFAHLDVDTYASMRNCLALLDQRMAPRGLIVLDDFGSSKCPGVKRAAMEFMNDRTHYRLIRLMTEQALLIKT